MRAALCATLLVFATATLVAQSSPSHAVKVTGTVVRSDSGAPLPKVQISLHRVGHDEDEAAPLTTVSDNAGRFSLDLAPGQYALEVSRTGFVLLGSGRRHARGGMVVLTITPGAAHDVRVRMEPAGAITGRVVDPDGDPVAGINVRASRVGSGRGYETGGSAESDDLGEYRIYNLTSGSYYICADAWRSHPVKQTTSTANGPQTRTFILGGGCYPSGGTQEDSSPVAVRAGDEVRADLSLQLQPAVSLSGTVLGVRPGEKSRIVVNLRQKERDLPFDTEADASGAFHFAAVPSGTYEIVAMVMDLAKIQQMAQMYAGSTGGMAFSDAAFPGMQIGRQEVTVGETDVSGVQVLVHSGVAVRGRMTASDMRPLDFSSLQVGLVPADVSNWSMPAVATVKRDGSFTFGSVQPGDYHLAINATDKRYQDYFLAALAVNGRDDDQGLIHIDGPGTTIGLRISANGGSIEGVVTDATHEPVGELSVVAVPDAAHRGRLDLFGEAGTNEAGHFSLKGLAPGTYSIVLDSDGELGEQVFVDPKKLEKYLGNARTVEIRAGSHQTLNLQIPTPSQ